MCEKNVRSKDRKECTLGRLDLENADREKRSEEAAIATSSGGAPTTLQTMVKSSSVVAVSTPSSVSSAPGVDETGDDEDECE